MTISGYVPDPSGWMFLTAGTISIGAAVADDSPLLPELWELVAAGADASAVLDALTRGGISSTPDFVIVAMGARGKVLVRGAATVVVDGSEHATLTGAGFSSWAELVIDRIDRFSCEVVATTSTLLPLVGGVVRAGSFSASAAGVAVFAAEQDQPVLEAPPARGPAHAARPARAAAPAAGSRTPSTPSEQTVAAVDEIEEVDDPGHTASAEPPAKPSAYDHLFGDTSYRTVEDAAVRPETDDAGDSAPGPGIEDRTVVASDLAQLRAKRRASRGRPAADAAPAPAFFVELSTGGREPLDQPLVIGRAPSAAALAGDRIPRLITMTTANQDISRTHAQISVEGGTVVVTDLNSRNGTIVTLPGRAAQKLREGETTPVIPGTIIDLGDGATLTVREA